MVTVSTESRRGKGTAVAAWAVLAPLLLLALYILSLIPLALTGRLSDPQPDWVSRVYAPLQWAYQNTPLRAPIQRYGDFLERLERKGRPNR